MKESKCILTNISEFVLFPTSTRACNSSTSVAGCGATSVSVFLVIYTFAPDCFNISARFKPIRKVGSFSRTPVGPIAPESLPP